MLPFICSTAIAKLGSNVSLYAASVADADAAAKRGVARSTTWDTRPPYRANCAASGQ